MGLTPRLRGLLSLALMSQSNKGQHPMNDITRQRLRRAIERARAHDFLNVGFGQRFAIQSGLAPGVWLELFVVLS